MSDAITYEEDYEPGGQWNGSHGAKREAFPVPKDGDNLVWRGRMDAGPLYHPYVIKCVGLDEPFLHFMFLKSSGQFGPLVHTIDLNDQRLVWRKLPSTLAKLSEATPCAFLFLTDDLKRVAPGMYADGCTNAVPSARDTGTGGTGKWPRSAGVFGIPVDLARILHAGCDEKYLAAKLEPGVLACLLAALKE
jgi:hypothetical protein